MVGDPVEGQGLLGFTNAVAGFILAVLAPFLGAIADKSGRRKPWVAGTVFFMVAGAFLLWTVRADGSGLGIPATLALIVGINIAFTISEVFHNAMLPSVILPSVNYCALSVLQENPPQPVVKSRASALAPSAAAAEDASNALWQK